MATDPNSSDTPKPDRNNSPPQRPDEREVSRPPERSEDSGTGRRARPSARSSDRPRDRSPQDRSSQDRERRSTEASNGEARDTPDTGPGAAGDRPQTPTSARSIAASQAAIVTTSRPTTEEDRDRKRRAAPSYRRQPERGSYAPPRDFERRQSDYSRTDYGRSDYRRPFEREPGGDYGGGGYGGRGGGGYGGRGGSGGGRGSGDSDTERREKRIRSLVILAVVAILTFFAGFALRDLYTAKGGFDDERPIQAEQVPANLRDFCFTYNGLPSFTLINIASTSALSTTSVPVLKLDTCTIPTRQTANALGALGVRERSVSVGLQLGGSNLTLVNLPLTNSLANQLFYRFPVLADSLDGNSDERKIEALEEVLDSMLRSGANGLSLQNVIKTNLPDVYAVTPGHTFQLQPDIQSPP